MPDEQCSAHRLLALAVVAVVCAACNPPAPPSSGVEQINGTERLAWDQQASSVAELATFRYNIYVDNTAVEMQSVSCADSPGAAGFACNARLPQMSPGQHTLALTAFIEAGTRLESARSGSITVNVVQAITMAGDSTSASMTTPDGVRLRAETVATGLDQPTDLAFTPDGRILIAERAGRIRVFRDGRLLESPAAALPDVMATEERGLMALAVAPDYGDTHHVFALFTAIDGWRIVRFRAVADTLGDRAMILDRIDAPLPRPAAALRFGPDAKLYAAIDDAGDPTRAGDAGSFNGKVLRLNPDGTTPADQGWATPVYALNVNSPRGIDWDAGAATMWVVEDATPNGDRLQGVVAENPAARPFDSAQGRRGTTVVRYTLPPGTGPSGAVLYSSGAIPEFTGNLLIAASEGRSLLRIRFDPANRRAIVSSERLLRDVFGPIRAIGVAPDGTIYFCTHDSLVALFAASAASPASPAGAVATKALPRFWIFPLKRRLE